MDFFMLLFSLFAFTYVRGPIEQQYPPSCLYLSADPLSYANLTQTNADTICAKNVQCAGTRSFLSFNTQPLIDRYSCSDTGPYACGTYIELGRLMPRTVVEPLFRRLAVSGINDTEYWSLTSTEGQFLDCAVADTTDNIFLFDWQSIQCNGTRHFLCECIQPNSISNEIIVLVYPPFQFGDIGFSDGLIRIVVGSWYVTSVNLDPPRNVELYNSGATIQTNGSFSIERVNEFGPYTEKHVIQLREANETFVLEYMEDIFSFSVSHSGNDYNVSMTVPRSGLYEMIVNLDTPANETRIQECNPCFDRFCQCAIVLNSTLKYSIRGYTQTRFTSRISARFIVS